jgi:hypothetical protein
MPFGDQLRTHEDVDLPFPEIRKHAQELAAAPGYVAVQAGHPRARKKLDEFLLDLLSSLADIVKVLTSASRTNGWKSTRVTAVVTDQAVLAAMIGERDGTIHTALRLAAAPA